MRRNVYINPDEIYIFPKMFKQNFKKILANLGDNAERKYVSSLLDPFHPSVTGVRIPRKIPRELVSYNETRITDV